MLFRLETAHASVRVSCWVMWTHIICCLRAGKGQRNSMCEGPTHRGLPPVDPAPVLAATTAPLQPTGPSSTLFLGRPSLNTVVAAVVVATMKEWILLLRVTFWEFSWDNLANDDGKGWEGWYEIVEDMGGTERNKTMHQCRIPYTPNSN